jgi:fibro-slime domain-containing protein
MLRKRLAIAAAVCGALGVASAPAVADTLSLTGVVRDFKRGDQSGGHKDFQTAGSQSKFGHVINMVAFDLGSDKLPVFNPTRPSSLDTMYSSSTFSKWFRDDPAVNASQPLTLTLSNGQSAAGGVYSYSSNAFFPIDGKLLGNQGLSHNYHFTFELHTKFTYKPGQSFTFVGDDDVWVYIKGVKVMDLGGVHSAVNGTVVLFDGKAFCTSQGTSTAQKQCPIAGPVKNVSSTLASQLATKWQQAGLGAASACPIKANHRYFDLGMASGDNVTLDFFFAERHTTESNFRIDTSILLQEVAPTTIAPLYD